MRYEKNLIRKYTLQEGQQGPEGFRNACSSTSNLLLFRFAYFVPFSQFILLSSFSFATYFRQSPF